MSRTPRGMPGRRAGRKSADCRRTNVHDYRLYEVKELFGDATLHVRTCATCGATEQAYTLPSEWLKDAKGRKARKGSAR